ARTDGAATVLTWCFQHRMDAAPAPAESQGRRSTLTPAAAFVLLVFYGPNRHPAARRATGPDRQSLSAAPRGSARAPRPARRLLALRPRRRRLSLAAPPPLRPAHPPHRPGTQVPMRP